MKMIKKEAKGLALRKSKGFTLLELLIVIAILAILSVTLVLVLNPAESLRKSRDTQRMSDLATLKTALGLYMTSVSNPDLDADVANFCLSATNAAAKIGYSAAPGTCTTAPAQGDDVAGTGDFAPAFCLGGNYTVDGTGWIPVKFTAITGGSPISNLPLDPTNSITANAPTSANLVYRYTCQGVGDATHPSNVFELNAVLESDTYKGQMATDGGDNTAYYEVGTSLKLMGASTGNPTNF